MSVLPAFRSSLVTALGPARVRVDTWTSGGRRSAHLIQLSTSPKKTLLYVKEFNVPGKPGFWGLTLNQVIRLEDSGLRWFAVLLLRSAGSGYVLTGTQVRHRINDELFKLSGDGDHKVNEPDLRPAHTFARLEDLLDRVL